MAALLLNFDWSSALHGGISPSMAIHSAFDPAVPAAQQLRELKEQMAVIDYGVVQLHIGWSPPHEPGGRMAVHIRAAQGSAESNIVLEAQRPEEAAAVLLEAIARAGAQLQAIKPCILRGFDWKIAPDARDALGALRVRIDSSLDPRLPLKDQELELGEDLAQAAYARNIILDVGWYGRLGKGGEFAVRLIVARDWGDPARPLIDRDVGPDDWDEPELMLSTRSLAELPHLIAQVRDRAIELVASGKVGR